MQLLRALLLIVLGEAVLPQCAFHQCSDPEDVCSRYSLNWLPAVAGDGTLHPQGSARYPHSGTRHREG
jgi:hypothetical protein